MTSFERVHFGSILTRADGSKVAFDHDETAVIEAVFGKGVVGSPMIDEHLRRHASLSVKNHAPGCALWENPGVAPGACTCGVSAIKG